MLKISDTPVRNISLICKLHFEGVESFILSNLRKSQFNEIIKKEIEYRLKGIITGEPEALLLYEKAIYNIVHKYRKNEKKIKNELISVFNYPAFLRRPSKTKWNLYKLADRLKVNTCVYCNRQYTFTVEEHDRKVTRPQFDHFFSKDKHPILALSFYNLIPCCPICNLLKLNIPFNLKNNLHPYQKEFGESVVFTYIPNDYLTMIGRANNLDVKILVKSKDENYNGIINQKKIFKLEKIYNEHSDYIQEIIWKGHISKGLYLKWIRKIFGNWVSNEEVYRLALGNFYDKNNLDKRVLSKLTKDIAKEIDLIE